MTKEQIEANYDEDTADMILYQLIEDSEQIVHYGGEDYIFDRFHYDGVLLTCLTEEFRQVFVGKWWVQDIEII